MHLNVWFHFHLRLLSHTPFIVHIEKERPFVFSALVKGNIVRNLYLQLLFRAIIKTEEYKVDQDYRDVFR